MSKKLKQFLEVTYSGRELQKEHDLEETGLWKILGEDPNCDWGGSHHQPDLGIVEGKLRDVISYAVELPNFWTWGGGGSIRKISTPLKITPQTAENQKRLKAEKELLKNRLEQINRELGVKV